MSIVNPRLTLRSSFCLPLLLVVLLDINHYKRCDGETEGYFVRNNAYHYCAIKQSAFLKTMAVFIKTIVGPIDNSYSIGITC